MKRLNLFSLPLPQVTGLYFLYAVRAAGLLPWANASLAQKIPF